MTRHHLSQGFAATYLFSAADRVGARLLLIICTALLHSAVPVLAQDAPLQSAPAHVSFVDGTAVLERDGRTDASPTSMPVLAGDRVRTQAGRVEILYADGSALHLDQQSVVDFQSDEVVRLLDGRMRLNIAGRQEVSYRVDAPAAWVEIAEPGEYRIALLGGGREAQVELAVLRGAAELVNEEGRSLVRAGERAFARAGAQPSPPYVFNSAAWDEFDHWSESRRDTRLGLSAQYLPPDVRPYSTTFDDYGAWQYEATYGYVWYPRVAVGWRPYYHGRWASLRPYGWTWIAADPWGWPTHHYGRWGFSGSWFWIPGRHWGSAWVSWAYAPNYVSWCPLGWNNGPVFSFVNVNLNYHHGRYYDPWYAWTVVPRSHFGVGYVNANVVAGRRLDGRAFVVKDSAPDWRSTAARASAPIRTAGRVDYAVPRGTASSFSSSIDRSPSSSSRSFPAPSREPRVPQTSGVGSARSSAAPVTAAPQRAVPRDRGVRADTLTPSASRSERDASVGTRRVFDTRGVERGRSNDQPSAAAPQTNIRAVPRTTQDVSPDRPATSEWGRSDRSIVRPPARSMPQSRSYAPPDAGYRRGPESPGTNDSGNPGIQNRAIPRQDSPRPSYEAPRSSPRSYGMPSPESRQPSYRGGAERGGSTSGSPSTGAPSPSTGAPARGDSSSGSGQSRSPGGQPSRGQARSRG